LSARGKRVTMACTEHKTHGWLGLKIEDRVYEKDGADVAERQLKVTSSASVMYDGASDASGSSSNKSAGGTQQMQSTGFRGPDLTLHPQVILSDAIALHMQIREVVKMSYSDKDSKLTITPEEFQSYVATLYIETCKQGICVDYRNRAAKPVPPTIKPAPEDPANWKECMVQKGADAGKLLTDVADARLLEMYSTVNEKGISSPYANCIRQATKDRDLLPKEQEMADEDIEF
jgi:hypothetical protein